MTYEIISARKYNRSTIVGPYGLDPEIIHEVEISMISRNINTKISIRLKPSDFEFFVAFVGKEIPYQQIKDYFEGDVL